VIFTVIVTKQPKVKYNLIKRGFIRESVAKIIRICSNYASKEVAMDSSDSAKLMLEYNGYSVGVSKKQRLSSSTR
jgi:hypothetical protein